MIRVNLLPSDLRPVERTLVPVLGSIAVTVLILALAALNGLGLGSQISTQNEQLVQIQKELDDKDLRDALEAVDDLERKKKGLADRAQAVGTIVQDQTIWSEKLMHLARIVPEDVWLKEVEVITVYDVEQQLVQKPGVKELQMEEVRIPRLALKVTGYVLPKEGSGIQKLGEFISNIENDPDFSTRFTAPEGWDFENADFQRNIPVKTFTIECKMKPLGQEEEES